MANTVQQQSGAEWEISILFIISLMNFLLLIYLFVQYTYACTKEGFESGNGVAIVLVK